MRNKRNSQMKTLSHVVNITQVQASNIISFTKSQLNLVPNWQHFPANL